MVHPVCSVSHSIFPLIHEQDPKKLLPLGPTRITHSTLFWLKIMVTNLVVLIFILTASHVAANFHAI